MKQFVVFIYLICQFSIIQSVYAQDKKAIKLFNQAKLAYDNNLPEKSLQLLDAALVLDTCFMEIYLMKSDIYQDLDSVNSQIKVLETALRINSEKYPQMYFVLANAYYRSGLYAKALESYQTFLNRTGDKGSSNNRTALGIQKSLTAIDLMNHPVAFEPVDLGESINSTGNEYWPSLTIDGKTIIFTRLMGLNPLTKERNGLVQEDFYTSKFENNCWQQAQPVTEINTSNNEGAQSISADGKLLFFTACGRNDGLGSCDIYYSRNINGKWSLPQNAGDPVNSPSWETQASISANCEVLYFVSNRKGGKGAMDIWKCDLKGFSEWGKPIWGNPVDLGDSINTSGNEMSPFIHPDGKTLYFSSDYWPGLGGYDIFYCRQKNDLSWTHPKNIGYPINSMKDEQGFIVDASGENAYYSSDKSESKGKDIYSLKLYPEARPTPVSYIKGVVVDEATGNPICASVELMDLNNSSSATRTESSTGKGEFLMCLPLGKEYAFNVSKEDYLFYSENFMLKEMTRINDPYILTIKLKKIEIGSAVVLRNVFFNTGSFELLPESKIELQKLIDFLKLNQTLTIEIGGHTDNVGSSDFNRNLSEQRAKSVYTFLMDNHITPSRMTFVGYGFSKPISSNDTAEGRTLNRRTEFRILKQ